ncbi:MAG: hypothetical protein GY719_16235 [bacterium]|nr:hypothetical protein [bacterium]
MRLELGVIAFFSIVWLLAIGMNLGLLPAAGTLDLDLYSLYSIAAALGWLSGNLYVNRCRLYPDQWRLRLFLNYLLMPLSVPYLLRSLASQPIQEAAPLVPVYSFCVYSLFFLVPVTLRANRLPGQG